MEEDAAHRAARRLNTTLHHLKDDRENENSHLSSANTAAVDATKKQGHIVSTKFPPYVLIIFHYFL
jgi:hypothetical protein